MGAFRRPWRTACLATANRRESRARTTGRRPSQRGRSRRRCGRASIAARNGSPTCETPPPITIMDGFSTLTRVASTPPTSRAAADTSSMLVWSPCAAHHPTSPRLARRGSSAALCLQAAYVVPSCTHPGLRAASGCHRRSALGTRCRSRGRASTLCSRRDTGAWSPRDRRVRGAGLQRVVLSREPFVRAAPLGGYLDEWLACGVGRGSGRSSTALEA